MLIEHDNIEAAKKLIEETGVNLFLTGKAGTGKTTFLRHLTKTTSKRHVVLAPTGVAAINAGGSTIHSFFQLSLSPFIPGKGYADGVMKHNFRKEKIKLISTLDLIIIDEISMVRPDVLDAVDEVMRRYRNPLQPFGGAQLLLIGDLRQLAPVVTEEEQPLLSQYYDSPYFFESKALRQAGFLMLELTKVYRQSDSDFVDILNKIRDNVAGPETLEKLNRRANPALITEEISQSHIRLTTHVHRASNLNETRLNALPGKSTTFECNVTDKFPESMYPAEKSLTLKPGARVMFIKNDVSQKREYYNGLIGTVSKIENGIVTVKPDDASIAEISTGAVIWENNEYSLADSGEIVEKTVGTFSQLPLRLAWAITIHKSQGLTFDHAIIDASHSFAPGQTYVALSRCRSLQGLYLEGPLPLSAIKTDDTVSRFISTHPTMPDDEEQINRFRESYFADLLFELFDFRQIALSYDAYHRAVASTLATQYPQFVNRAADGASLMANIRNVEEKTRAYLSQALPWRKVPEKNTAIMAKVRSGCEYFHKNLQEIIATVRDTPSSIDNKADKQRIKKATDIIFDLLTLKASLLHGFTTRDFTPGEFLALKAKFLINPEAQRLKVKMLNNATAIKKRGADIMNSDLYNELKKWRLKRAGTKPAFQVLPNKTLIDISNAKPTTMLDLLCIYGMSKKRGDDFGNEILEIVKAHR